MERSNSIAGLELGNIVADLLDDASDIISLIDIVADPLGHFPVLWITAADNHLDEDLVLLRFRDGRVHDLDLGTCNWWSVQSKSTAEGFFLVPLLTMASFMVGLFSCALQLNVVEGLYITDMPD